MFLNRKIFLTTVVAGFGLLTMKSCEPYSFTEEALASFAVINAVPFDTVHVILDGKVHTPAVLMSGSITSATGSIYLPAIAGTRSVGISRDTGKTTLVSENLAFDRGSSSTLVVTGVAPQRKIVKLKDDLTLAADDRVKIRFIHAAPTTGAVDVTFSRGVMDSVTLTNRVFIGNATDLSSQEMFISIPLTANRTPPAPTVPTNGTPYTIRVKTAGTPNVISTVTLTLGGPYNSPQGRIWTAYLRGGASTVALSTTAARNY